MLYELLYDYIFYFEVLFTACIAFLHYRLFNKVLLAPKSKYTGLYLVLFTIVVTGLLRYNLSPYRSLLSPVVAMICSLPFLCFYNKSLIGKRIFYGFTLFTLSILWVMMYDWITSPIPFEQKDGFVVIVLMNIGYCLLVSIIERVGSADRQFVPKSLWWLLVINSLASLVVTDFILRFLWAQPQEYKLTFEIPVMCTLIFMNISLFIIFDKFAALVQTTNENSLLEQQITMQQSYYRQLEQAQNRVQSIYHDMKNHLTAASQIAAQSGEAIEVVGYLTGAAQNLQEYEQIVTTGNTTIDTILNSKIAELQQAHIHVETDIHIPPGLGMSFEQTVAIFGNLLDNAREACIKLPKSQRKALISLSYINYTLLILIENSTVEGEKDNTWFDGLPKTTKKDPFLHGIGLKNVKQAVNDNGTINVEQKNGKFSVEIVLYNIIKGDFD